MISYIFIVSMIMSHSLIDSHPSSKISESSKKTLHELNLKSDVPYAVSLPLSRRVKRGIGGKMRIKVFYDKSVDDLPYYKRELILGRLVPQAVEFWEDVLTVVNPVNNIKLNRKCKDNQYFLSPGDTTQYCKEECVSTKCGEYEVPPEHLEPCHTCNARGRKCSKQDEGGPGVSGVDFVLYVSSSTTSQCLEAVGGGAETVAYAAHCQQESKLDRPVAGHTNICPDAISDREREIRSLESTLKHELLHALGFSSSLFAFFRDENGNPRTQRLEDGKPDINLALQVRQWSPKTIINVSRDWKVRKGLKLKETHLMVTPRVVQEVRSHFGCPTLEGAELEDQGGDGTALTHWEKRIFQNEAMTGTVNTAAPVYTSMTFALLEDSGWYFPDYSRAQNLSWGKDAGCEFATKSCMELIQSQNSPRLFCNTLMQNGVRTSCTHDMLAVGSCNMVQYSDPLPDIYQNFYSVDGVDEKDVSRLGGSVTLADFCPFVQEFTWKGGAQESEGDKEGRGTRCDDSDNNPDNDDNYALEHYGSQSRCFQQTEPWEERSCTMVKQWSRYGSGCYRYSCEDGLVKIIVRNVTFSCNKDKELIPVELLDISTSGTRWLHSGNVMCPKCSELCKDCSGQGTQDQDVYALRENLGDCFIDSEIDDTSNALLNFLKEFGLG